MFEDGDNNETEDRKTSQNKTTLDGKIIHRKKIRTKAKAFQRHLNELRSYVRKTIG